MLTESNCRTERRVTLVRTPTQDSPFNNETIADNRVVGARIHRYFEAKCEWELSRLGLVETLAVPPAEREDNEDENMDGDRQHRQTSRP
jgi:hypothetical protein